MWEVFDDSVRLSRLDQAGDLLIQLEDGIATVRPYTHLILESGSDTRVSIGAESAETPGLELGYLSGYYIDTGEIDGEDAFLFSKPLGSSGVFLNDPTLDGQSLIQGKGRYGPAGSPINFVLLGDATPSVVESYGDGSLLYPQRYLVKPYDTAPDGTRVYSQTTLTCDAIGDGENTFRADITWSAVANAEGYVLVRTQENGFDDYRYIDVGNVAEYQDDGSLEGWTIGEPTLTPESPYPYYNSDYYSFLHLYNDDGVDIAIDKDGNFTTTGSIEGLHVTATTLLARNTGANATLGAQSDAGSFGIIMAPGGAVTIAVDGPLTEPPTDIGKYNWTAPANIEMTFLSDFGGDGKITFRGMDATPNFVFDSPISASNLSGTNTGDQDLSGYLTVGGKAADSDKLDGYDATAFATAEHTHVEYLTEESDPVFTEWLEAGNDCPTMVDASDSSVAEGNNSFSITYDKVLIKWLKISTTSTDWTLTIYTKDDYTTGEMVVIDGRSGDFNLYLDLPYADADETNEIHYNFASASGSETHDIQILGYKLK